jgi:hypothetical protein
VTSIEYGDSESLVRQSDPLAWPPRSPDITPLHHFLCGYVEEKVYVTKVTGAGDLKTRIRDAITTINSYYYLQFG